MNPVNYLTGRLLILLITIGLISMLVFAMRYALRRLHIRPEKSRELVRFTVAGLLIWLMLLTVLATSGFFLDFGDFPPRIFLAFLPPVLITVLLAFSRKVRLLLLAIPPSWLLYAQSFRIFMELFLWLGFRAGYVPPQMTFEWLNYDIIVGLTAPMAGYVFFAGGRFHRFQAIYWNIFGIALLFNIVAISVLSTPSPLRVFMNEPANTFIAAFPFIWIPGFIVPFALALHLFSIKQLLFTRPRRRSFRLRKK